MKGIWVMYENIPVRTQVINISSMLKDMGYKGMVYRWKGDSLLAVIWDELGNLRSNDIKKIDYKIPTSDYVGWPIVDGKSTNPNLSPQEKIDVVVKIMRDKNYPEEFISKYLKKVDHI